MSRIGRAIIEVLLKTEQAKAQMVGLKKDLTSVQTTTPAFGTTAFPNGTNAREAETTAARVAQAAKRESSAATNHILGDFKSIGSGFAYLRGAMLLGIIAVGFKAAELADKIINWSEDARNATDKVTAGVRNLAQELNRKASLKLDTNEATQQINDMREQTQRAIAAMNEEQTSFWANFFASFGFGGDLANEIGARYEAANRANAATNRESNAIRKREEERAWSKAMADFRDATQKLAEHFRETMEQYAEDQRKISEQQLNEIAVSARSLDQVVKLRVRSAGVNLSSP